jgi:hypothetical protein
MNRIGLDAADCVLRFLDLPAAVNASEIGWLWYRAHRRRHGVVVGYNSPEWFDARHAAIEPDDGSFGGMAATLTLVDAPSVEWLVVSFPPSPRRPYSIDRWEGEVIRPFDDVFLTDFTLGWLALQSLPALRALYVRIPPCSEGYYRSVHALSLACRPDRTPRLAEFGLCVSSDASNAFRPFWLGLRSRSLTTTKARLNGHRSVGIEAITDFVCCGGADLTFDASVKVQPRRIRYRSQSWGLPMVDDSVDRFSLVFDRCESIPSYILSLVMSVNTVACLEVTVRQADEWSDGFDWWNHDVESGAAGHRAKLRVLRFHLAGAGVKAQHVRAVLRRATEYYPGLETLEIDVRKNSIGDTGLPPVPERSHRLRRVCVWFSGYHTPSVPAADAWLAALHAACAPSVPPSDRSYRVVVTAPDGEGEVGPGEAGNEEEDPRIGLSEMRMRVQQDLADLRFLV